MIDAIKLGKLLAEEVINEVGPCFYPAKFKPPHRGHFKAAMDLASRNYINRLYIIISSTTTDGITPEDALTIWKMYVGSNPKIVLQIADPIKHIMSYLHENPEVDPVYVAASDDETDDENYIESLQQSFGDRVKEIPIHDKDGIVSAPYVRNILRTGDFEEFSKTMPDEAYNKGKAPEIFKMLATKVTDEQE